MGFGLPPPPSLPTTLLQEQDEEVEPLLPPIPIPNPNEESRTDVAD